MFVTSASIMLAWLTTTTYGIITPPNCNITGKNVLLTLSNETDWGYAGLEPNDDTFCIGKDALTVGFYEFFLSIDYGDQPCSIAPPNACGDDGLRQLILATVETSPSSMTSDALAGHLSLQINRTDWLVVVVDKETEATPNACFDNQNYCQITQLDSNVTIKFVTAAKLNKASPVETTTTTVAGQQSGTTTVPPLTKASSRERANLRMMLNLLLCATIYAFAIGKEMI